MPMDSYRVDMIIDGTLYEYTSAREIDGSGMDIYDPNIEKDASRNYIAWTVSCKVKDDELYMTVEEDKISDYEGKTIVLHQQPLEETTDEYTDE